MNIRREEVKSNENKHPMATKKPTVQKLSPTYEQILTLIYRFRFLNRNQIQIILNHKYHNRINTWLNELTNEKYLKRYYSQQFAGKPAYYSLGTSGRKYFKKQKSEGIKEALLDRVWTEHKTSEQFKRNCMFLADIYVSLINLTKTNNAKLGFFTKVDLYGMKFMVRPEPSAYFSIEDQGGTTKRYFLDIFDYFIPLEHFKRVEKYIYYFEKGYWQNNTEKPFPEIILVCPNKASKTYFEKTIKGKLEEKGLDMNFYLTTWEEIRFKGLNKDSLAKICSSLN